MKKTVYIERAQEKKARLDEYKEHLTKIETHAAILRRHGINPNTLIKLLSLAIDELEHQLNTDSESN